MIISNIPIHKEVGDPMPVFAPIDNSDPMIGKQFNNLIVTAKDNVKVGADQHPYYICECAVHHIITRALASRLISGESYGCQLCYNQAKSLSMRSSRYDNRALYEKWQYIKRRCNDPNYNRYREDLTICTEWNDSFDSFLQWCITQGYNNDTTHKFILDLKQGCKEYSPENCIFVVLY